MPLAGGESGGYYPKAGWQRCAVHFYRNVWTAGSTINSVQREMRNLAVAVQLDALDHVAIAAQPQPFAR